MSKKNKTQKVSGTKEWASSTANCVTGCEHECRYCYARYNMCDRFKKVAHDDWGKKKVRSWDVKKKRQKVDGVVMFPTTHDICPSVLDECLEVIDSILSVGNDILIVSKPHLECIKAICDRFGGFKDKILFRFTIGSMSDEILSYWEPGAPCFDERQQSLEYAFLAGFKTSVSCEPMLDSANIGRLFDSLSPYVTDSIWIGKLNHIDSRVKVETEEDKRQVSIIEAGQTNERIREIYEELKNEPKVKWKESFKEVLGLELATEIGQDI